MENQVRDEVTNRILKIIAVTNPTFSEAKEVMNKVCRLVQSQREYVGLGHINHDSKLVEEVFSLFIAEPTTNSEAHYVIEAVFKALDNFANQSRFSLL